MTSKHMKIMTIAMPRNVIELIDQLVAIGMGSGRSEFMRRCIYVAINALIKEEVLINQLIRQPKQIAITDQDSHCVIEIEGHKWVIPNRLEDDLDEM